MAKDLGFSAAQVALRAGHDPAVASSFYTGNVADAVADLLPTSDWARDSVSEMLDPCWIPTATRTSNPEPVPTVSPGQGLRPRQDSNLRPSH